MELTHVIGSGISTRTWYIESGGKGLSDSFTDDTTFDTGVVESHVWLPMIEAWAHMTGTIEIKLRSSFGLSELHVILTWLLLQLVLWVILLATWDL